MEGSTGEESTEEGSTGERSTGKGSTGEGSILWRQAVQHYASKHPEENHDGRCETTLQTQSMNKQQKCFS